MHEDRIDRQQGRDDHGTSGVHHFAGSAFISGEKSILGAASDEAS